MLINLNNNKYIMNKKQNLLLKIVPYLDNQKIINHSSLFIILCKINKNQNKSNSNNNNSNNCNKNKKINNKA